MPSDRASIVILSVVLGPPALFCVLFIIAFFGLVPGFAILQSHACFTQPQCVVFASTRFGKPVTGHFQGGLALFMAALLAVLGWLFSWIATTRMIWLAGEIGRKPTGWSARWTGVRSLAPYLFTLAYLGADALLVRLIAGPLP
jgi:hypothetical protein